MAKALNGHIDWFFSMAVPPRRAARSSSVTGKGPSCGASSNTVCGISRSRDDGRPPSSITAHSLKNGLTLSSLSSKTAGQLTAIDGADERSLFVTALANSSSLSLVEWGTPLAALIFNGMKGFGDGSEGRAYS